MTANPFRFAYRVVSRLRDVDLARAASSLSFTTLLAIVPLFTVAFAFVARFPLFQDWLSALEQFLLRHMLPFTGAAEIRAHVIAFAGQAARLTGVSIALIGLTAALAVATVEREINAIWGIRRGRSLPMLRRSQDSTMMQRSLWARRPISSCFARGRGPNSSRAPRPTAW